MPYICLHWGGFGGPWGGIYGSPMGRVWGIMFHPSSPSVLETKPHREQCEGIAQITASAGRRGPWRPAQATMDVTAQDARNSHAFSRCMAPHVLYHANPFRALSKHHTTGYSHQSRWHCPPQDVFYIGVRINHQTWGNLCHRTSEATVIFSGLLRKAR